MSHKTLKINRCREVKLPERTGRNAGFDFFVPDTFGTSVLPGKKVKIPSGIKVRIPEGHALIAFNKSSIADKKLIVGACVIDENYTGEISLHMINVSQEIINIEPKTKLVQFILIPVNYATVEEVDTVNELYNDFDIKERGEGGFGSTNNK